jgi:hypothetical protein
MSAKEVRCTAIQVDGGDAAFLLMAEATVAIVTASLSTVVLGVLSSLGVGTIMIIPGLLLPQQCPQLQQQQRVGLGVGGVPMMGATSQHPLLTTVTFSFCFHPFDFQVKWGGLSWLY